MSFNQVGSFKKLCFRMKKLFHNNYLEQGGEQDFKVALNTLSQDFGQEECLKPGIINMW